MNINSFKLGNFAFYRDPYGEMKLESDNLFDQMTPDGKISVYFFGKDTYIPDFGTFKSHVITNKTFYWDIVDENGNRTKEGLEAMWISRNPNMKVWYGDLIPTTPSDVFDWYNDKTAATKDEKLITANLWFYNSLFLDQYFRYYVILLPKGKVWPDENNALILPMNDKLVIPKGYYIVGYRPKPEYRFQLATMPIIKSGRENAIHFQIQLNLEYVFSNPKAERYIKIFSSQEDIPRYMLYPESPLDIIWDRFNEPFIAYYKRYLLKHGVQQYLPSHNTVNFYIKKRQEFLKYSNLIDKLDGFNFKNLAEEIKNKKKDSKYKLEGIADYVYQYYMEYEKHYVDQSIKHDIDAIMTHILYAILPWNGFKRLFNAVNNIVVKDDTGKETTNDFKPVPVSIVEINGAKQFEDGWVPKRAVDYIKPPEGYIYAGAIGNGMYLIEIDGKPKKVLCDMENGGWMFIMDGMRLDTDYVSNLIKGKLPENLIIEDMGVSFGSESKPEVLFYSGLHFNQLKIAYVDLANACGEFKVEIYSPNHMFLFGESVKDSDCYSNLLIDGEVKYSKNKQEEADFYITKVLDKVQNNLTIKMSPGVNFNKVRKFIKFLWAR